LKLRRKKGPKKQKKKRRATKAQEHCKKSCATFLFLPHHLYFKMAKHFSKAEEQNLKICIFEFSSKLPPKKPNKWNFPEIPTQIECHKKTEVTQICKFFRGKMFLTTS